MAQSCSVVQWTHDDFFRFFAEDPENTKLLLLPRGTKVFFQGTFCKKTGKPIVILTLPHCDGNVIKCHQYTINPQGNDYFISNWDTIFHILPSQKLCVIPCKKCFMSDAPSPCCI